MMMMMMMMMVMMMMMMMIMTTTTTTTMMIYIVVFVIMNMIIIIIIIVTSRFVCLAYDRPTCNIAVLCLTSKKRASVSQPRIYSDNCTCCHTESEFADHTCCLAQSKYSYTAPTSPRTDLQRQVPGRVSTSRPDVLFKLSLFLQITLLTWSAYTCH